MASAALWKHFTIIIFLTITVFNSDTVIGQTAVFSTEPSDVQVRAGENGKLQCIVSNGNGKDCYWNRNDQKVNMDKDDRYKFTGDLYSGDCSITIYNSNVSLDDGMWECGIPQTSEEVGSKSKSAKYTVLVSPKEPIITVNDQPINNGGYIMIDPATVVKCWSENGKPAANLTWKISTGQDLEGNYSVSEILNNDMEQTATNLLTTLSDASWEDQELTCEAKHPAYRDEEVHIANGIMRSRRSTLSVNLTSNYEAASFTVPKNKDVILSCIADGIPAPSSELKRKLPDAEDWDTIYASKDPAYNFTVTISAFDAQFKCFATNDNGKTTVTSNIITIVTSGAQQIGIAVAVVYWIAITCIITESHRVSMS